MFYETRIQRTDATDKTIRENYLISASTFTDVETALVSHLGIVPDSDIISIRHSPVAEVYHQHDAGDFYRIRLVREYTKDNGRVVTSNWYILLRALNTDEATRRASDIIQQGYDDFKLTDIVKTKIVDVL